MVKISDITTEEKLSYYERLIMPYHEKGIQRFFIDQYLIGNGKELKSKFWSKNSSSRLAFDLYSWIAKEPIITSFQFEKKLPGVICSKKGTAGVPNMDVYFETKSDIVFIESKYLEKTSWKYKNGDLSKAYWDNNKYGELDFGERFYGKTNIAKAFSNFCNNIQNSIDHFDNYAKEKWNWFDAKQETCHLFGIIFYLLNARKENQSYLCDDKFKQSKKIHLYNIIWELESDDFEQNTDSFPVFFEKQAVKLVKTCLGDSVQFDFIITTIQELLKETHFHGLDFTKAIAFGTKTPLDTQMKQYIKINKKR